LHRIAFPVVSEWCQKSVDHASVALLQTRLEEANHLTKVYFARRSRLGRPQDGLPARWLYEGKINVFRSLRRAAASLETTRLRRSGVTLHDADSLLASLTQVSEHPASEQDLAFSREQMGFDGNLCVGIASRR
jgi:hypothetical protein